MNRVYRKDVTDSEIERAMNPVLQKLSRFLAPRVKPESQEGQKRNPGENRKEKIAISKDEKEYLKSILEYPNLSVTARGEKLFGFSADKRTRIKRNLLDKKLIEEFSVDLGRDFGGRVKFLELADAGYKIIGKAHSPKASRFSKRGSLEHIWWQRHIARDYEKRGYKAIIEKELNGKSSDIGVIKDNEIVAVEIELSPKNAVTNLKQNIDAGFTRTMIACKNNKVKKIVDKKITSFMEDNPDYRDKAKIILLTDFPFIKKLYKEIRG